MALLAPEEPGAGGTRPTPLPSLRRAALMGRPGC